MIAALALLLVAVAAAPDDKPVTVAVSYFDNNTGKADLDPLAKGLADMLITDLSQVRALRIVEREKLNQVLGELKLSRSKFIDPKTAVRLGKGLAARYILSGGYALAGDTLRIDARVFDVQTGAVLTSESVTGKTEEFFALEKDIADLLIVALKVKLAPSERSKLRGNATQSFAAWSAYAAGLDSADKGDVEAARAAYARALEADPNYRAARTASERLTAIFARNAAATSAQFDSAFRELDPKAPDFPEKVDGLLLALDNGKSEQLARKVALLTWLGRRDLLACRIKAGSATGNTSVLIGGVPQGGVISFCRQAHETLAIAFRLVDDPTQWSAIPRVCEHFIHKLPGDQSVLSYCENALMKSLAANKQQGAAAAGKQLTEDDEWVRTHTSPDDWRRALIDNRAAMRALLQIYAGKGR